MRIWKILSVVKEMIRAFEEIFSPKIKYIIRLDEHNFNVLRPAMGADFPVSYDQWLDYVFKEEMTGSLLNINIYCDINAYNFILYCRDNERVINMTTLLEYARLK